MINQYAWLQAAVQIVETPADHGDQRPAQSLYLTRNIICIGREHLNLRSCDG